MSIELWDRRYTELREHAAEKPAPLLVEAVRQSGMASSAEAPRYALDLACGAGRNALWLAEQGWKVTAVDGSSVGIGVLRERAWSRGVTIKTQVADLEAGEFPIQPSSWDLIVVYNYLQRDLFAPVKAGLKPGGIAVVSVHLQQPESESRFSLAAGELAAYFAGWDIPHSREGVPTGGGGRPCAEIVARRPVA